MPPIKPQFHERQYEFCMNADLVNRLGALIAGYLPGIPSPQEEGELGWDASVALPTYGRTFLLQYKIARLTNKLAGGNARFWSAHKAPYYRFGLHADRDGRYTQHRLLLEADTHECQALYCAPLFHETQDLVQALRGSTVVDRSQLVPVGALGPVSDRTAHSVTYPADPSAGIPHIHSESRPARGTSWDEMTTTTDAQQLDEAYFERLAGATRERAAMLRRGRRSRPRSVRSEDPRAAAFLQAAAAAHDELNATLVVVPAS